MLEIIRNIKCNYTIKNLKEDIIIGNRTIELLLISSNPMPTFLDWVSWESLPGRRPHFVALPRGGAGVALGSTGRRPRGRAPCRVLFVPACLIFCVGSNGLTFTFTLT